LSFITIYGQRAHLEERVRLIVIYYYIWAHLEERVALVEHVSG